MPAWGIEMLADTPQLNAQAGAELALTAAWALLCNIELVHNAGLLGACKVCSAESSVWADEQIAYARRGRCGPCRFCARRPGRSSTCLIDQVGPGGDYVTHGHTLANFRSFLVSCSLASRDRFDPREGRPAGRPY